MFIRELIQKRIMRRQSALDSNQGYFDILVLMHVNIYFLINFNICLVMLANTRFGQCGIAVEFSDLKFQAVESLIIASLLSYSRFILLVLDFLRDNEVFYGNFHNCLVCEMRVLKSLKTELLRHGLVQLGV